MFTTLLVVTGQFVGLQLGFSSGLGLDHFLKNSKGFLRDMFLPERDSLCSTLKMEIVLPNRGFYWGWGSRGGGVGFYSNRDERNRSS